MGIYVAAMYIALVELQEQEEKATLSHLSPTMIVLF